MFSLSHFINKKPKKTFSTINSQVASLELAYCFPTAKYHELLYNSSKEFDEFENISYIITDIHLHDIFVHDLNFDLCFANYYVNNELFSFELFEKIVEDVANRKAIFLNVAVGGYGYNKDEDSNFYIHSISIIFQPDKDCYKGIIINSHGNATSHEIETIMSRKRIKKVLYKEGIDVALMRKLVTFLNKHLINNSLQTIKYIGNKKDTYLGANLQSSDWRGFCYMYPFIIFHYYGEYYNSERKLDDCLTIQSSSKLLKNGNIMKFVNGIFAEFNEKFKEKIIEIKNSENKKYLNSLEDVIVSQDYRFIKDIISPYLSFLKQKCLKNYR
uniref:Uncharacterized protein n=1 Tax=viral metagenome TaxID=1070528 RepID=A0A6C0FAI9_9ZZZZ|tara:strand:- start:460 stop:1443 length:984 start_codon:yes stop_codon:yes gene_type:complete